MTAVSLAKLMIWIWDLTPSPDARAIIAEFCTVEALFEIFLLGMWIIGRKEVRHE